MEQNLGAMMEAVKDSEDGDYVPFEIKVKAVEDQEIIEALVKPVVKQAKLEAYKKLEKVGGDRNALGTSEKTLVEKYENVVQNAVDKGFISSQEANERVDEWVKEEQAVKEAEKVIEKVAQVLVGLVIDKNNEGLLLEARNRLEDLARPLSKSWETLAHQAHIKEDLLQVLRQVKL